MSVFATSLAGRSSLLPKRHTQVIGTCCRSLSLLGSSQIYKPIYKRWRRAMSLSRYVSGGRILCVSFTLNYSPYKRTVLVWKWHKVVTLPNQSVSVFIFIGPKTILTKLSWVLNSSSLFGNVSWFIVVLQTKQTKSLQTNRFSLLKTKRCWGTMHLFCNSLSLERALLFT